MNENSGLHGSSHWPREIPIKGRGAALNPANRFIPIHYQLDDNLPVEERPSPRTRFLVDQSRTVLTRNTSPDLPFEYTLNPYRGCEHGCSYCYARPTHEYLGFSAGLDFETQILVKADAPSLLRQELRQPAWKGELINLSGVTDCYQPIERQLQLTRQCLQVIVVFRQACTIVTKNRLITRDVDLLQQLARHHAVEVSISITTLDEELAGRMEPRATRPPGRLEAIRLLAQAGIPVGLLVAPIIPGLNDHEIPAILRAAREHGDQFAGSLVLRLPYAIKELFADWLQQHYPRRKDKVLQRIRELRDG
ncbi:MAG TPA: PA0069 family radical SAM protein, partial [Gemmatales bacterium]|nr:PA0069 family radical SAM protein [Gemmatales bacterium]